MFQAIVNDLRDLTERQHLESISSKYPSFILAKGTLRWQGHLVPLLAKQQRLQKPERQPIPI